MNAMMMTKIIEQCIVNVIICMIIFQIYMSTEHKQEVFLGYCFGKLKH